MTTYFNASNDLDRLLTGMPTETLIKRGEATHEGPRFTAPPELVEKHAAPVVVLYREHCQGCGNLTVSYGYAYRPIPQPDGIVSPSVIDDVETPFDWRTVGQVEVLPRHVPCCGACLTHLRSYT